MQGGGPDRSASAGYVPDNVTHFRASAQRSGAPGLRGNPGPFVDPTGKIVRRNQDADTNAVVPCAVKGAADSFPNLVCAYAILKDRAARSYFNLNDIDADFGEERQIVHDRREMPVAGKKNRAYFFAVAGDAGRPEVSIANFNDSVFFQHRNSILLFIPVRRGRNCTSRTTSSARSNVRWHHRGRGTEPV